MSVNTAITLDEARRKAEKVVRFELGTFPRLGAGEYNNTAEEFQFPLIIRSPQIIRDTRRDETVDVRFFSELDLGTVTVDGTTGDVDRPGRPTIQKKIREYENKIDVAVQKALISAAGRKFSHLPFPENQYSPLEDILSHLLLQGEMSVSDIEMMDEGRDNNRYHEYVEKLIELDLADQDNQTITSGDILISLQEGAETHQEVLNAAVGRYFEHNIGEFNMIKRTLGPYLALAGHYYRKALELEEMPIVDEEELSQAISLKYSGREEKEKLLKMSRYLIQLENVGILESTHQGGRRYWTGDGEIRDKLRTQSDYLAPVEPLMA